MAIWQVTKASEPTGDIVDDELHLTPGEEGFSNEAALQLAEELDGDGVSYVGPSEVPKP